MKATSRANVVSSFTIVKGAMIDETYAWFERHGMPADVDEGMRRGDLAPRRLGHAEELVEAFARGGGGRG